MAAGTATRKPSSTKGSGKKKGTATAPRRPRTKAAEARPSEKAMAAAERAMDRAKVAGVDVDKLNAAQVERLSNAPAGLAGKELATFIETGTTPSERGDGQAAFNGDGSKRAREDAPPLKKEELESLKELVESQAVTIDHHLARAPKGDVRTGLLRIRQSHKQTIRAIAKAR
jgi:hypothetical protein